MATTQLVQPGQCVPIGDTGLWLRVHADPLNTGRPVAVTWHPIPLAVQVRATTPGWDLTYGPPPISDEPADVPEQADPLPRRDPGESLRHVDVTPFRPFDPR